ncbi:MAG: hypothetical protein Ct9H300mP27_07590 [Chloroflexota bacterium]|nr:MAG: hypothetical protein Ct9H300mP27_07590 [Chloroflexota bacterium]
MNTNRANELGLREGDVVKIETNGRSVQALLYPNPALPPNVVSVPIGQGHQVGSTMLQKATTAKTQIFSVF